LGGDRDLKVEDVIEFETFNDDKELFLVLSGYKILVDGIKVDTIGRVELFAPRINILVSEIGSV
jgi:hypothetical protein